MTTWVSGTSKGVALLLDAGPAKKEAGTAVSSGDALTLMTGIGTAAAPMISVLRRVLSAIVILWIRRVNYAAVSSC